MKKEKTVRTYQRRTKSGKMVTVHEHKASYDAAEEARKATAKKVGAGSELSKKKAVKEESPLGFSADDYKAWYHWDMEDDANNEAALRVEKALTKKMGKKAYNKYLEDMSNSYSARGHKKAHQSLLDEHTERQKKQDAEISKAAKDIARGAKEKAAEAKASKSSKSKKTISPMEKIFFDRYAKKHGFTYEGDGVYSNKKGENFVFMRRGKEIVKKKVSSAKTEKAEPKTKTKKSPKPSGDKSSSERKEMTSKKEEAKAPRLGTLSRERQSNVYREAAFKKSFSAERTAYVKAVKQWAMETDPSKKKELLKKKNSLRKELGYGTHPNGPYRVTNYNNSALLKYEREMSKFYKK